MMLVALAVATALTMLDLLLGAPMSVAFLVVAACLVLAGVVLASIVVVVLAVLAKALVALMATAGSGGRGPGCGAERAVGRAGRRRGVSGLVGALVVMFLAASALRAVWWPSSWWPSSWWLPLCGSVSCVITPNGDLHQYERSYVQFGRVRVTGVL